MVKGQCLSYIQNSICKFILQNPVKKKKFYFDHDPIVKVAMPVPKIQNYFSHGIFQVYREDTFN